MMRAGRDYRTKGAGVHGEPRDRLVKRGVAKRIAAPTDAPAPKRQASRKPAR